MFIRFCLKATLFDIIIVQSMKRMLPAFWRNRERTSLMIISINKRKKWTF